MPSSHFFMLIKILRCIKARFSKAFCCQRLVFGSFSSSVLLCCCQILSLEAFCLCKLSFVLFPGTFSKIDLSLEASLKLLPLEALLAEAPKFISRKLFMHSFDISLLNKIFIYIKVPIYCDNEFNNIWVLKRSSFQIHLGLVRSLDIRVLHLLWKSDTP